MRIDRVIAINAADGVGPTRLVLLTAGSSKLPVVVMAGEEDLARGGTTTAEPSPERKRGLWQRLSRSS